MSLKYEPASEPLHISVLRLRTVQVVDATRPKEAVWDATRAVTLDAIQTFATQPLQLLE
jgi:hypothetical protein